MDPSSFAFQDPFGNSVQLIESSNWYKEKGKDKQGGVLGVVIGVSDIQKSVKFYKEILGFDIARDMKVDSFKDLNKVAGERNEYNRVILSYTEQREGPFAKLLGSNEIELIQILNKKPRVIFQDRYWGDQGFIHLCFDVQGMSSLKNKCNKNGYPFTVDSADSFDMGKAAGRFAYIEDPDGTLIEFVETHKIPILPQIGWYYNLSKRGKAHLPDWLIKLMFIGSK
jgi:catechol 2,3-dioxygenase-like lactoylglutathione lyase family enzyme